MKKVIIVATIVSLFILTGCIQQLSDKVLSYQENYELIGDERVEIIGNISNTIYESIDRSNSEATELIIDPIFQEGNDVILPEGRYAIAAQIAGNVFVRDEAGELLFHDIIAPPPFGVGKVTFDVNGKHIVHVDGFEQVFITPVATQLSNELSPGIWEVGKDIEEGSYTVTGDGFGYLQIFQQGEEPKVYELLGATNQEITLHLKEGQKVKITRVSTVQFNKNDANAD